MLQVSMRAGNPSVQGRDVVLYPLRLEETPSVRTAVTLTPRKSLQIRGLYVKPRTTKVACFPLMHLMMHVVPLGDGNRLPADTA